MFIFLNKKKHQHPAARNFVRSARPDAAFGGCFFLLHFCYHFAQNPFHNFEFSPKKKQAQIQSHQIANFPPSDLQALKELLERQVKKAGEDQYAPIPHPTIRQAANLVAPNVDYLTYLALFGLNPPEPNSHQPQSTQTKSLHDFSTLLDSLQNPEAKNNRQISEKDLKSLVNLHKEFSRDFKLEEGQIERVEGVLGKYGVGIWGVVGGN